MTRRSCVRSEAGFTLVELLVTVVVEALIVGALGMAFVAILRGGTNVKENLSRTGDARIAAAYIISDARNADGPGISRTDTTSCGSGVGATPVVSFTWNSTSTTGGGTTTLNVVDYVLVGNSLVRRQCQGGGSPAIDTVASNVSGATAVCSPTADCSGAPTSITVTVSETADSTGAQYTYSLTGTFRKLLGSGAPPNVTPSPVYLLGAGTCSAGSGPYASGLVVDGGSKLVVHGVADINTGDVAGAGGCTAMSIGTDAGDYVADSTRIYAPSPGSGTCAQHGSATCPTSPQLTNYSPPLTDPYASLPAPPGVPVACTGSNQGPDANGNYPSGVYPQPLTITSTTTLTGTYIFCHGVTFSSGANVTGTSVLLYLQGGTMSIGGSAQVSLTAATSGAYSWLAVWQPTGNSTTMTITNGGKLAITGSIYAPSAEVYFTGGSVTTTVTAIVSKTLFLDRGASVTIGTAITNPTITSATPSTGAQSSLLSVTINGTNFATNAVASYSGIGVTVSSTTWVSATRLTANVAIAANATVGAHDLTVTNGDGGTAARSNALTVTAAATPTSFSISVNAASSATIAAGAQATLAESGLPGAGATGAVTFTSGAATLCTATLPATSCLTQASLTAGNYPISANFTDTDGNFSSSAATNTVTLIVNPGAASVMTLTNCVVQGVPQACNGPYKLGNGGSMTAKVTVTDAFGNVPANTTLSMSVVSGDTSKFTVSGSPISISNGTVSTTFTVNKLGNGASSTTITIHATSGPYADLTFTVQK